MSTHSDTNRQAEDLQLGTGNIDQVLRSGTKRKESRRIDTFVADDVNGEENYPKSIEKQRYVSVESHSPFEVIFDDPYQKSIPQLDSPNDAMCKNQISNSFEKVQQSSTIKAKQCSQIVYDSSFEDRNSVQTMDSKPFSSSFELDDRQIDQSSEGAKANRLILLAGTKNKDYFDHYIIEDDEENEEEKRTQANAEENSSQRSFQKIELERQNSETHYDHSRNNSEQREKSLQGLDIQELKLIGKRRMNEKNEINAAFKQTRDENEALAQRVNELEKLLKKTLIANEKYQHYYSMVNNFGVKQNTRNFDQSVKHFRKYSL